MADERVETAIRHWAARFIANGVDYNDFVRTTASIDRWDQWLDAWTATADVHAELADRARDRGRLRSAGEAYLRAAVSYHFSKFVWVLDRDRNRREHARRDAGAVRRARTARSDRRADRGTARARDRIRQPAPPARPTGRPRSSS